MGSVTGEQLVLFKDFKLSTCVFTTDGLFDDKFHAQDENGDLFDK